MSDPAHADRLSRQFDRAARRYDLLNTMNPGYRKHLRWSAERLGAPPRGRILDLCCGTGLSTEALRRVYPEAELTGLDASGGMLEIARGKRSLSGARFLHGDATDPAAAGAEGPYDAIFMAYGIRNVSDRDGCLRNLLSLLSPGGRIAFHEYSVRDSAYSRAMWTAVAGTIIVPLGTVFTGSPDLFRYLHQSVVDFDGVGEFIERLSRAGFEGAHVLPTDGWQRGVAHTFTARKPIA